MASPAAGELVARHIAGADLPPYAADFGVDRYADPGYVSRVAGETGQL